MKDRNIGILAAIIIALILIISIVVATNIKPYQEEQEEKVWVYADDAIPDTLRKRGYELSRLEAYSHTDPLPGWIYCRVGEVRGASVYKMTENESQEFTAEVELLVDYFIGKYGKFIRDKVIWEMLTRDPIAHEEGQLVHWWWYGVFDPETNRFHFLQFTWDSSEPYPKVIWTDVL